MLANFTVKFKCVMIIDHDYINNFFNEQLILEMDLTSRAEVFTNGADALRYIQNCARHTSFKYPGLILLDADMPHMDSAAFLKELQKTQRQLRMYILGQ